MRSIRSFYNNAPVGIRSVLTASFVASLAMIAMLFALQTMGGQAHAQSVVPVKPTGLTYTAISHNSVALSWNNPTDSSIIGYQILRRSRDGNEYGDGEGASEFVAVTDNTGTTTTSYTDSSVTPRTRYVYRVKARNATGLSPQSSFLNVETTAAPTILIQTAVAARPTGLTYTSVSHNGVTLSWDNPADNSITGYQILRRSRDGNEYGDGGGAWEFGAVTNDTGTATNSYTDSSVTSRTRYVYRVKARNAAGLSPQSSYLNVETPEPVEASATFIIIEPTPEPTPETSQQTQDTSSCEAVWVTSTMTLTISGYTYYGCTPSNPKSPRYKVLKCDLAHNKSGSPVYGISPGNGCRWVNG